MKIRFRFYSITLFIMSIIHYVTTQDNENVSNTNIASKRLPIVVFIWFGTWVVPDHAR